MATPPLSPFENRYTLPMPDPQIVFSQPGYYTPKVRMNVPSVIALICGAVGLVIFPLLPIAVVCGFVGLRATKNHVQPGYGAALAGMCLGLIGIIMWLMIFTASLIM